jgi:hypothetical protein
VSIASDAAVAASGASYVRGQRVWLMLPWRKKLADCESAKQSWPIRPTGGSLCGTLMVAILPSGWADQAGFHPGNTGEDASVFAGYNFEDDDGFPPELGGLRDSAPYHALAEYLTCPLWSLP